MSITSGTEWRECHQCTKSQSVSVSYGNARRSQFEPNRRKHRHTSMDANEFTAIIVVLFHTEHCIGSSLAISTSSNDRIHQSGQPSQTGDIIAIKEGADLDLSCPIVVRNEDMIISWTCDDEPANIRSSRIHVTESGKLRIHSAKVGDSCNYRCEAANDFGTLSVVIKVIIVDRHRIDQLTRRTSGQNVTMPTSDDRAPDHRISTNSLIAGKPASNSAVSQLPNNQTGREIGVRPPGGAGKSGLEAELRARTDKDLDIEMQIEPAQLSVIKNLTFSLECRIKYPPHPVVPQIIWLKEFIGPKPVSIQDSIEQNLIQLDDIYYHSLNWPRSVTYSNKSRTASSALLIRQSSYVHSGRYICLAGYPSAIMNLHFNRSIQQEDLSAPINSQVASSYDSPAPVIKSPLKYKIARAYVEVDDKEGKINYQLSLDILADNKRQKPSNLFMSVISNNSWMRNLTIALMLLCSMLALLKFIQLKRQPKTSGQNSKSSGGNSVRLAESQSRNLEKATSSSISEMVLDRSLSTNIPLGAAIDDHYIDEDLFGERLKCLDAKEMDCDNDHVYSEIGYHDSVKEKSEPYYKQPKGSISKSAGE